MVVSLNTFVSYIFGMWIDLKILEFIFTFLHEKLKIHIYVILQV